MCSPTFLLLAAAGIVLTSAGPSVRLNNGVEMPVIAAGTWQFNNSEAQAATTAAFAAGFRHIDTAYGYCADPTTHQCNNHSVQKGIGAALAASGLHRSDYFITTKVPGCGFNGVSMDHCGADSLGHAQNNLDELGIDFVDLLLVHFPPQGGCDDKTCPLIREQWSALSGLIGKKTMALGVSNFCISCFKCLLEQEGTTVVPAVNQVQYHVGMGTDPEGLLSYCASHGIVSQAYSPLGTGSSELINGPLVTKIGAQHNKTGVQVSLHWIWQHNVTVVTKSASPTHLEQDLDIFDWNLSEKEMRQLDESKRPSGTPSFLCTS